MISIRSRHLGTAQVDHGVLRQVSAIVATLPVMTESGFKDEFLTVSQIVARAMADSSFTSQEYSDVQLTSYLANMTKTLATLNDVRRMFFVQTMNADSNCIAYGPIQRRLPQRDELKWARRQHGL
jgi:COP9 signalosome complex subunit 6